MMYVHLRPRSLHALLCVWGPSPPFLHSANYIQCCTVLTSGAGLAAVATSVASYMAHPAALADPVHLTSTFLGTFIGAVTLTGSFAHVGIIVTLQLCRAVF